MTNHLWIRLAVTWTNATQQPKSDLETHQTTVANDLLCSGLYTLDVGGRILKTQNREDVSEPRRLLARQRCEISLVRNA